MRVMLAAVRAELLQLETFCGRLLILCRRIVPVFAFAALERDYFSWHILPLAHPEL